MMSSVAHTGGVVRSAGFRRLVSVGAAVLGLAVAAMPGLAQDAVTQLNRSLEQVTPDRRSETVLLPALAALESPPLVVDRLESARLLAPGMTGWDEALAWVIEPSQQGALDALREVTAERRYERAKVFGQPYGVASLSPETILSGMYTDLGDPPLIAAAHHKYLPKMQELRLLVHVEASRLVGEGRHADAADLLLRLCGLGRQMIDRPLLKESLWGYQTIIDALQRVRDVVYQDFRGERRMSPAEIVSVIEALREDGFLAMSRLRFPEGNRLAARQLIERVYEPRGGAQENVYLSTMVRLGGSERPLRRFAGASRWAGTAQNQADWYEVNDEIERVYSGWSGRWDLNPFDPVLKLPFAIDTVENPGAYAVVIEPAMVTTDEGRRVSGTELFELRKVLKVERVGTRQALAVVGRYYETELFPPQISSVRAQWLGGVLGADAYNENRAGGREPPMEFFVPVRDAYVADRRDDPEPHRMEVFPGDGTNFGVTLFDDQFLLYSVGPNGAKDWAERVSQDRDAMLGDYLLWPPVLSLHRAHLVETGQLR